MDSVDSESFTNFAELGCCDSFFFSDKQPFVPYFQRGQVVVDKPSEGQTSTILINLPFGLVNTSVYHSWIVQWRRVGNASWKSVNVSTKSTNVSLPGRLDQSHSYELRLQAVGKMESSPYTIPLRFPLELQGKCFRNRMRTIASDCFSILFNGLF